MDLQTPLILKIGRFFQLSGMLHFTYLLLPSLYGALTDYPAGCDLSHLRYTDLFSHHADFGVLCHRHFFFC